MIRSGRDYLDSIRDDRQVYINGERVADITRHPAFKPIVDIRARIYDMQQEAATRDSERRILIGHPLSAPVSH